MIYFPFINYQRKKSHSGSGDNTGLLLDIWRVPSGSMFNRRTWNAAGAPSNCSWIASNTAVTERPHSTSSARIWLTRSFKMPTVLIPINQSMIAGFGTPGPNRKPIYHVETCWLHAIFSLPKIRTFFRLSKILVHICFHTRFNLILAPSSGTAKCLSHRLRIIIIIIYNFQQS